MGFHADQEAARVLGLSINNARLGLAALYSEIPRPAEPLTAPPAQTVTPRGTD